MTEEDKEIVAEQLARLVYGRLLIGHSQCLRRASMAIIDNHHYLHPEAKEWLLDVNEEVLENILEVGTREVLTGRLV